MTNQTNNGEFYSDEQKISLMSEAIKIFDALAPEERAKVRKKFRWKFLDGTRREYRTTTKFVRRLESRYDRSDVFV